MVFETNHIVLGQGNFVLAVGEGTFAGQPTSFYDLFRVENGKIAEHWDVMETILPAEEHKNDNGKFNYKFPLSEIWILKNPRGPAGPRGFWFFVNRFL